MWLRSVQAQTEETKGNRSLEELWEANPEIYRILASTDRLDMVRLRIRWYLDELERGLDAAGLGIHPLERTIARDCIRTFKNVLSPRNEELTGISSLKYLWELARNDTTVYEELHEGFLEEFYRLFRGVIGQSGIYEGVNQPASADLEGREAAVARSRELDKLASLAQEYLRRYLVGLHLSVIRRRQDNQQRVLSFFGASNEEWLDWRWQLQHVIRDEETLSQLVELTSEEREAIQSAREYGLPFGVTPYYASLMDRYAHRKWDHAIRAQVIHPLNYIEQMIAYRHQQSTLCDFMRERDTSPLDGITRRYPTIAILKPYNSCSQICVYCQRNWEITQVLAQDARLAPSKLNEALDWIDENEQIQEVLITGGDPLVLEDAEIRQILQRLAEVEHIERIRIGTRTPVVMPMRITPTLVQTLKECHEPGRREVCLMTHFEHAYEVTDTACQATQRLRQAGIPVYNQQVFTIENSRRFESVALRKALRLIGVDSYYTFHTKAKEETQYYRVPIARLLQEKKEEARLMPGLVRTDEPVFNVPRLGKNYLHAWQDHEVVMIHPDGGRIYEFHPWEKNISPADMYLYKDVPILEYLRRLEARGEDLLDYQSIWYYY